MMRAKQKPRKPQIGKRCVEFFEEESPEAIQVEVEEVLREVIKSAEQEAAAFVARQRR